MISSLILSLTHCFLVACLVCRCLLFSSFFCNWVQVSYHCSQKKMLDSISRICWDLFCGLACDLSWRLLQCRLEKNVYIVSILVSEGFWSRPRSLEPNALVYLFVLWDILCLSALTSIPCPWFHSLPHISGNCTCHTPLPPASWAGWLMGHSGGGLERGGGKKTVFLCLWWLRCLWDSDSHWVVPFPTQQPSHVFSSHWKAPALGFGQPVTTFSGPRVGLQKDAPIYVK